MRSKNNSEPDFSIFETEVAETPVCYCPANKYSSPENSFLYDFNYNNYVGDDIQKVDLLIIVEHFHHTIQEEILKAIEDASIDYIKYAIIPGLGCNPVKNILGVSSLANFNSCSKYHIADKIKQYSPRFIITMGKALYSITNTTLLEEKHFANLDPDFNWIYSSEYKCKVFPSYSVFDWYSSKKNIRKAIQPKGHFFDTLNEVSQLVKIEKPLVKKRKPTVEVVRTIARAKEIIEILSEIIAIDIETEGLDFFQDKILSVQICDNPNKAYFLYWGDEGTKYLVNYLLNSKEGKKKHKLVFHYGQFDIKFFKREGYDVRIDFDTLHAVASVNENIPKTLKFLTWIATRYGGYEQSVQNIFKAYKTKSFSKLPSDILEEYGAYDVISTRIGYDFLKKKLDSEPEYVQRNYLLRLESSLHYCQVEMNGIPVNLEKLEDYNSYLVKLSERLEESIKIRAEWLNPKFKNIDTASYKQISDLLNSLDFFQIAEDVKGDPLYTNSGQVQLDKEALDIYSTRIKNFELSREERVCYKMLYKLKRLNSAYKELGQLGVEKYKDKLISQQDQEKIFQETEEVGVDFDNNDASDGLAGCLYNGRVYGNLNPSGTRTGRNSSGGGLRSKFNLQNAQKLYRFRQNFSPKDGYFLLDFDYATMEVCQISQMSGKGALEKVLVEGLDLHCYTASNIMTLLGNPISYEEFYEWHLSKNLEAYNMRQKAKVVNFSVFYGVTSAGLVNNLGISYDEADTMLEGVYNAYPEFVQYMEDMINMASHLGYVLTLTGNKRRIPLLKWYYDNKNKYDSEFDKRYKKAKNEAINSPIQGSSGQTTNMAMIEIQKMFNSLKMESKIILNTHDSLSFEVPKDEITLAHHIVKVCMEHPYYINPTIRGTQSSVTLKASGIVGNQALGYGDDFEKYCEKNNIKVKTPDITFHLPKPIDTYFLNR